MLDSLTSSDWVLALCTLLGPILAVGATRFVDAWRERRARQEAVFVALMATRRAALTAEHVQALNRIEIEFAKNVSVTSDLRAYMRLLEDRAADDDRDAQDLLLRRRRQAFAHLVQAIGRQLGRPVDRMDILEGGYYPGGWAEAENLQLENMRQLNKILKAQIPLPVWVWLPPGSQNSTGQHSPTDSPFPPPPEG